MTPNEAGMQGALTGFGIAILISIGIAVFGVCVIAFAYFKKKATQLHKKFSLPSPAKDQLYAKALAEIKNGNADDGLWARCLVEAEGDKDKSTAFYIKRRVAQLQQATLSEKVTAPEVSESEITKPKNEVNWNGHLLHAIVFVGLVVLIIYANKPTISTPIAEVAPVVEAAPVSEDAPAAYVAPFEAAPAACDPC